MPIKRIAIINTAQNTWTVPLDWDNSNNFIELIGSGGTSEDANNSATGQCNGSGGGAYAKLSNFQLTPGQTVYINVGKYLSTKDTWVNKDTNAEPAVITSGGLAKGGQNGTVTAVGLGGQAAQCIGNTTFSGGNGGLGTYNASNVNGGGGGGGAAGPNGAGKAGGAGNSANSGNNGGGGGGGAGGGVSTAGTAGTSVSGIGGIGPFGAAGGDQNSNAFDGAGGGTTLSGGNGVDLQPTTPIITVDYAGIVYGAGGGGGGCNGAGLGLGTLSGGPGGAGGSYGGGGGGQRSYLASPPNNPGGEPISYPSIPNGSDGIILITYGTENRKPTKLVFTDSTSWTVPNDWDSSSNTIELIGGGGAGARYAGAGGGAGGSYTKVVNLNLLKQQVCNIVVGVGGIDTNDPNAPTINGGDSTFSPNDNSSFTIQAYGGKGGTYDIGGDGLISGGTSVGYNGDKTYYGGSGGAGNITTFACGGGGGSAGPGGNGKAGGAGDATAAGDDGGGGGGGASGLNSTVGTIGSAAGGAGGLGPAGTGSGTGGSNIDGAAGTLGGGGGGGDQSTNGGAGGSSNELNAGKINTYMYSNFFDGTGDYLSLPITQELAITGDFTIEAWIYPNGTQVANATILNINGAVNPRIQFGYFSTPTTFGILLGNTFVIGSGTIPTENTWNHIAVTRLGTQITYWLNGVSNATATSSITIPTITAASYISVTNANTGFFNGYISNLRVNTTTALYTTNFAVSSTSLTATGNTKLLTCQNSEFKDNSISNLTLTPAGNAATSILSPFNVTPSYTTTYYSAFFDGAGDYIETPLSSQFGLGTGDFTIEFWVYPTVNSRQDWIDISDGTKRALIYYNGSAIVFYSAPPTAAVITGPAMSLNTWQHIAVSREAGSTKLFVNGTQVGSTYAVSQDYGTSLKVTIGKDSVGTTYATGYLSNVRVIKGSAIYITNFTPSTKTLTAVTNTVLLTCQSSAIIDNSVNNFTLSVFGNTTTSTTAPFNPVTSTVQGPGGGGGGGGAATTTVGGAGALYGGGGGGGNTTGAGGAGAPGIVYITYYPVQNPTIPKVTTVIS